MDEGDKRLRPPELGLWVHAPLLPGAHDIQVSSNFSLETFRMRPTYSLAYFQRLIIIPITTFLKLFFNEAAMWASNDHIISRTN
jgi:hypothetical protein